jgi:molecular chaperone GrpE
MKLAIIHIPIFALIKYLRSVSEKKLVKLKKLRVLMTEDMFFISKKLRDDIVATISNLQRANALLTQEKREQKFQVEVEFTELFLELLEVHDSLESLIGYLSEYPDANSKFAKRLIKSLDSLQRKLLKSLSKRGVSEITINQEQTLDYSIGKVVGREYRTDLPDKTVIKIVKKGFYFKDKVLRPVEVITSQLNAEYL